MIFRRSKRRAEQAPAQDSIDFDDGFESTDAVLAEIARLMDENRINPDRERERRILHLRHLAGIRHLKQARGDASYAEPDQDALPEGQLPPIAPEDLTPGLIRAGILRDGAVLVRGAVTPEAAQRLADGIEQAFVDRAAFNDDEATEDSIYEEFVPEPGFAQLSQRAWIEIGGGVLAADSPQLSFQMLDAFERIGLTKIIREYLGEPAAVSVEKCTLRKVDPSVSGAWHQDGNFMGDVRALNVWLSLSHCGEVAPSMDVVPKRIDYMLEAGTDGAPLSYVISQQKVDEAAGATAVIRPVFEPGDILLFDDLFVHQTGSDPNMPNPRYAIESWFFGASGFPAEYAPLAA